MINTSITGAVVALVIVTFLIGLVTGLALAGADVFNPYRNQAIAERIQRESAIQTQRAELELQAQQKEQELRLQALEQQLTAEQAHQQAIRTVKLTLLQIGGISIVVAVSLAIVAIGIAVAFRTARSRPGLALSAREEELRATMRRLARENERLQRRLASLQQELLTSGNGKRRREPVALDT